MRYARMQPAPHTSTAGHTLRSCASQRRPNLGPLFTWSRPQSSKARFAAPLSVSRAVRSQEQKRHGSTASHGDLAGLLLVHCLFPLSSGVVVPRRTINKVPLPASASPQTKWRDEGRDSVRLRLSGRGASAERAHHRARVRGATPFLGGCGGR
jgi:hypothetical protein